MRINARLYNRKDVPEMIRIWNRIVIAGDAYPQADQLTALDAYDFFASQSATVVAETETGEIAGLYILHPNNVGRCSHIGNASYAVKESLRGNGIGQALVRHSLETAKEAGFRVMQFNAVVENNFAGRHIYEKIGFTELGVIPGGFALPDGTFTSIHLFYKQL